MFSLHTGEFCFRADLHMALLDQGILSVITVSTVSTQHVCCATAIILSLCMVNSATLQVLYIIS